MDENLFKVFFIISYESKYTKKIEYSLSNENGIKNLKISFTQKIKNDDMKEYIIPVFSFDINNIKEENIEEKANHCKAIINFTIENDNYKEQIIFKRGRNNFIYNFNIKDNPNMMLLGQSSQLKIFYEALKEQKAENRDDILKDLILDSINFLKENDDICFNFFLELLKLCFFNKERNSVLLNFQIEKIKLSNNLNPKDYTSILSLIEKNPTKFCNENDDKEKEEINEKFYMILLCFIANYESDEKIKKEKIEKLLNDKKEYLIKIIPLYIQHYSNIKIPENYVGDIFMKTNLTYDIIKGILNCFPLNLKRLQIISLYRDSISEFCTKNDTKLNMIELAPPQKDDNLEELIFEINSLINYQVGKNLFILLFEQEYWIRYYKFNQTTGDLLLINSLIKLYQIIDKNLKTIDQLNISSTPSEEIFKNCVDIKQLHKRLVMPTIGNISVGKSFYLNSMFGIDFCQVKSEITTKFILFIRHIDNLKEPRLYKLKPFKKGNSYEFFYNCKEIFTGDENIKNKINQINDENKNSKDPIFYMLEIEIKSIENKEFLNNFDFLDVPGLNESGEDYINLYFEYIKDMIKYCLIIFSVENYNSKDSMEVIKKLKKNLYVPIENFLIILNKIDTANDLEKTIRDLKKVVLNDGSFNIYKNTLVPVDSLKLKSEIQMKNNCTFYDFINYYLIEYNKNKKDEEGYIDFIKKIMNEEKNKINNMEEIKKKKNNISDDEMDAIKKDFKRLEKEKINNVANLVFYFNDKKEENIIKLFYIFFKEKLLIPKVSNAINDINNYFNNIKDYDFPNKSIGNNIKEEKEYIFDDSNEHIILKELEKFFEEIFTSEKSKNYGNIINILKDDFKILKNYIFNSSLCFIPILGVSNSGKSSFINCLLGKNILPCDSSECTRRAIIIRYLEEKEKTSLYSIKFNSCENLNDLYYYYTKKELISENLEEIKEIISILNESFPTEEEDSFLLLETNIKFLENSEINSAMKKREICFIDFPGHNTNNNYFFKNDIYQKVLKMSSFFIYINSGKAFKENSNKELLSSAYKKVISIRKSDISSKLFIDLCLFVFNKVDTLEEKERDLNEINKEIKETLEINDDKNRISCSFFSSKLYNEYLSKIEEYKTDKIVNLFKQYYIRFKSQENDDLFEEKEESFINFVEDNLKKRIKSDYDMEEFDLNNITEEKTISNSIYKEINTYLDKFYEENNLKKEKEENYNDKLINICKYLILCKKNNTKLNLYKVSYASNTFQKMIEKLIKSHFLKEAEYNNHLERFLTFMNIFFGMGGPNATENNNDNVYRLIQISLNNVEKAFEDFKGNKIIEKSKNILLQFLKEQKSSFNKLMEENNKDVNKIIEYLENKLEKEMNSFKNLLVDELNNLEKNVGDELNKIGSEMISINKEVANSLSTKEKLLVSISFCTLGVGAVVYGLFFKLPNLIINAVSEERKFLQFLEEIEEKIIKEFQNIKDSIDNNIKSYKNIVTKNIMTLDGVIKVGNIQNDEYWKNAKEKYLIIYNNFKTLEKSKNLLD